MRSTAAVLGALLCVALFGFAVDAQAASKEVVVLTSFPKELFEAYKQAFELKFPGVRLIVKQQQTNQAVTYVREARARPEADIFWASAVDAFQTLKGKPEVKSRMETEWDTLAKANYAKARELADSAPGRVK